LLEDNPHESIACQIALCKQELWMAYDEVF